MSVCLFPQLLVEYIDYGNEEETEIKKLRKPLSDPLFSLPAQAVKCKLHDLPPPGVSVVSYCYSSRIIIFYLLFLVSLV